MSKEISEYIKKSIENKVENVYCFCPLCNTFINPRLNYNQHRDDQSVYWNYDKHNTGTVEKGWMCEELDEYEHFGGCGKFIGDGNKIIEYNSPEFWKDKSYVDLLFDRLSSIGDWLRGDRENARHADDVIDDWISEMRQVIKLEKLEKK